MFRLRSDWLLLTLLTLLVLTQASSAIALDSTGSGIVADSGYRYNYHQSQGSGWLNLPASIYSMVGMTHVDETVSLLLEQPLHAKSPVAATGVTGFAPSRIIEIETPRVDTSRLPLSGSRASHSAGTIRFYMRLAPALEFPTGLDDSRTSTVDSPFWIGETEVTYELWYAVREWATSNGYRFANAGREGSHGISGQPPGDRRTEPVTMVNWRDSIVWCNALSEMLGYEPVYTHQRAVIRDSINARACDNAYAENRNGFRLPTTDEWELAARYAGDDASHGAIEVNNVFFTPGSYASGAKADFRDAAATQRVAWYQANTSVGTNPVASKEPNGLGLFDMSGNVWEWCYNQVGLESTLRRLKGGSLNNTAHHLQIGLSRTGNTHDAYHNRGLRLARSAF